MWLSRCVALIYGNMGQKAEEGESPHPGGQLAAGRQKRAEKVPLKD